jgi:hypothetical protein
MQPKANTNVVDHSTWLPCRHAEVRAVAQDPNILSSEATTLAAPQIMIRICRCRVSAEACIYTSLIIAQSQRLKAWRNLESLENLARCVRWSMYHVTTSPCWQYMIGGVLSGEQVCSVASAAHASWWIDRSISVGSLPPLEHPRSFKPRIQFLGSWFPFLSPCLRFLGPEPILCRYRRWCVSFWVLFSAVMCTRRNGDSCFRFHALLQFSDVENPYTVTVGIAMVWDDDSAEPPNTEVDGVTRTPP